MRIRILVRRYPSLCQTHLRKQLWVAEDRGKIIESTVAVLTREGENVNSNALGTISVRRSLSNCSQHCQHVMPAYAAAEAVELEWLDAMRMHGYRLTDIVVDVFLPYGVLLQPNGLRPEPTRDDKPHGRYKSSNRKLTSTAELALSEGPHARSV
ncbi:hypothetical protein B0H10DRAFT_1955956 [Mycena sp. CBHHK59/15]|nr:hypothetical protein B0H10DRAFT_1955956 [Mycena sp. CBHHK59/15]